MAKAPADLLDPVGELEPTVLWKGATLAQVKKRLQGYLDDGYGKADVQALEAAADQDAAAVQWAYYRAYAAVYRQMVRRPSTIDVTNEGSSGTLLTQITLMGQLADQALAAYEAIIAEATAPEIVEVRADPRGSVTVPLRFTF